MGNLSVFADEPLDSRLREIVETLSGSVTPEQARWLSGYFAGLEAGIARQGGAAAPPLGTTSPTRTLTVLHGGETGNSAGLARAFVASASARGLHATVADLASYKPRQLKAEQDLVLIVATHGEGEPPQPALNFFEFIEGPKAGKLPELRFAVLALGDSSYEYFCEAGKRLDCRFEELGATRIAPRVDCDVDYDEPAAVWATEIVDLIATAAKPMAAPSPSAFATSSFHDKRNPFDARVVENVSIVGRHSSKDIRHIELDIAHSGLTYQPGDGIGIVTRNGRETVEALLAATGLAEDARLTVKGEQVTLAEAFEIHFEISTTVPRFLDHWAGLTGAERLQQLGQEERRAERLEFLREHHVVDIVRNFPLQGIDAETFVAGLRPLQPRVYSLSSSIAALPDEAHITLSPVRYRLHGQDRNGVASAHLADRSEAGATLPVYIQPNDQFRLPTDDVPIIMVGPGTGVAPFRAFLQEREARGATGRNWLFFGDRNFRSDFLYQVEWQEWLKGGLLTRMDVAFSRDGVEKLYVQHRMIERADELFGWLEDGAHFYVCGDAEHMAPDVHDALITVAGSGGGMGRDAADAYVRELQRSGRYHRDVY
ncbi:MAG: assimilatory sulfite reductase (NADPH) flavoprotein subunit [Sphingomonadales bacterium]|nr:assimilatory sulfite reductase (NADPH) flavoprotein subunit [Sphingomonadales bacterium]